MANDSGAVGVNISETGVFFDTKTGKVVDGQPEEGIQIVAPGGEVTPAAQKEIDAYRVVEAGSGAQPAAITTADVSRQPAAEEATAPDAPEKATAKVPSDATADNDAPRGRAKR